MKKILAKLYKLFSYFSSKDYWERRYAKGKNSGAGSYGEMAKYKSDIINKFVYNNNIEKCIEFGCGDGNQLQYLDLKEYTGFDISPTAIEICRRRYQLDSSKQFWLMKDYSGERAELVLSLEVLFHLVEKKVWKDYLHKVFSSSTKFVIIFSSNTNVNRMYGHHILNRNFTNYVKTNYKQFKLHCFIENKLSLPKGAVRSHFYIYKRI